MGSGGGSGWLLLLWRSVGLDNGGRWRRASGIVRLRPSPSAAAPIFLFGAASSPLVRVRLMLAAVVAMAFALATMSSRFGLGATPFARKRQGMDWPLVVAIVYILLLARRDSFACGCAIRGHGTQVKETHGGLGERNVLLSQTLRCKNRRVQDACIPPKTNVIRSLHRGELE